MLDTFRKRTNNLAFTILILLIVAVMAMFGIDMADQGQGGGGAAAFVNGEVITQAEFQQELQARLQQYQQILGAQYDEKLIMQLRLPQQTLRQLIQYKLLAQQATHMDIIVPDAELASHIRALPYFQVEGKFDASLYARLPNKGFEERRQRERLQVIKLQDYLQKRVRLSPDELRRNVGLSETKIALSYAAIDLEGVASSAAATNAEIATVLAGPEETLRDYYASHTANYTKNGRARIYQIRVGLPFQASEKKKQEAREKIEQLKAQVTAKNFMDVAKKSSDDEYAKKGGDRGWIPKGTLGQSFETAIDSLSAGQVSGIVETTAGYFLVYVAEKEAEQTTPFAEAKKDVAKAVANEQKQEALKKERLESWNAQLAQGRSIEPQLKADNVSLESTGEFTLGQGYLPKIGEADAILDAVFTLSKPNQVVPKLIEHAGKYYYVKLTQVSRPKASAGAKGWTEVENSVSAGIQNELMTRWTASLQKDAHIKEKLPFGEDALAQL